MTQQFDVIITGGLEAGHSREEAIQGLAGLFRLETARAAALLDSAPQVIKRNLEREQALRYLAALKKVGVAASGRPCATPATTEPSLAETPATPADHWTLADAGSELLAPGERHQPAPVQVDTTYLALAPEGPMPQARTPAAPDFDFSALSVAPPGPLQDQVEAVPLPEIDTSALSVAEVGEDLLVVKPLVRRTPVPDLSHLDLAPPGSPLLAEEEKHRQQATVPDTSHLSLG